MNANHRRRLEITFAHVDELLSDAVQLLSGADAASPLGRYVADATPVQHRVVADHARKFRALVLAALERLGIPPAHPRIGALHAARTSLLFAEVALEEVEPERLKGYGALTPEDAAAVSETTAELRSAIRRIQAYLSQGAAADLGARLARLESTTGEAVLLGELERVIGARSLVELRPALATLVGLMESPSFELAVFGRVSSGKSSLLNHIVRRPVLPVGVTPITAVPTRIVYGPEPRAAIRFAERDPAVVELARLREFAAEQENPGNRKHVTAIEVQFPEDRLKDGVTLVDTPGLGSLATLGAAETLAYLPRADLGVLLADASSSLAPEDVDIVDALLRAGARAMVVLSKSDLLAPDDRARVKDYTEEHLAAELGTRVPVHLVSVVGAEAELTDRWFESELLPLFKAQREERARSLRRKVGALREAAVASLRGLIEKSSVAAADGPSRERAERELRRAGALREKTFEACRDLADLLPRNAAGIFEKVAANVAANQDAATGAVLARTVGDAVAEVGARILARIEEARTQMAKVLELAAAVLDEGAGETVELPAPKNMPVVDSSDLDAPISLEEPLLAFLGRSRERSYRSQLQEQVGSRLSDVLGFHRRRLEAWCRQFLDELQQAFDARAEVYRLRLSTAANPHLSPGDREGIEADVRELSEWSEGPIIVQRAGPRADPSPRE